MRLLEAVVAVLRERRIPHAVIGATALAFHGVSRATGDLDLFAVHVPCLDRDTWRPVVEEGYAVDIRPGDESDPLAGVVRFEGIGEAPVDLVLGRWPWQAEILSRAEPQSLLGVLVPVVRATDLVLLKLYTGGPQDRWDIAQLLSTQARADLVAGVQAALPQLPDDCTRLWERVLAETASA